MKEKRNESLWQLQAGQGWESYFFRFYSKHDSRQPLASLQSGIHTVPGNPLEQRIFTEHHNLSVGHSWPKEGGPH